MGISGEIKYVVTQKIWINDDYKGKSIIALKI